MKGDRYRNVAFLGVDIFLSAILSGERFFNGVCEQKALQNQPVEVKGWPEGLRFPKGKSSGGGKGSCLSLHPPKGPDSYFPKLPVAGAENCFDFVEIWSHKDALFPDLALRVCLHWQGL